MIISGGFTRRPAGTPSPRRRADCRTMKKYRLGVDVGGTHTDLVLLEVESGAIAVEKVSTTPANPALGIMHGVGKFATRGVDLRAVEFFSHGTTITTNALLQMRGAKVGLLINRGFRAIQETQG